MRGAISATALLMSALLPATAVSKEELFGQETVEVRPFRQAPPTRRAHSHKDHAQGSKDHAHAHGAKGHSHAHGSAELSGHAHSTHTHAGHLHGKAGAKHPHDHTGGHAHAHGAGGSHDHGLETEHVFGFTTGSDIGPPGHKHLIVTNDLALGKRAGSYAAGEHAIEYAFTPWKDFHIGISGGLSSHAIAGVPGFDDRRQYTFDHVAVEFRQRLMDRKTSPFGLTFVIEPHWGRVDEASGERVNKTEVEFTLAADKELIADRLFVAFNAFYTPELARSLATGETERSSAAGVSFAVMQRVLPQLYAGAELRYARAYDGLALGQFAGQAVFLGPMLYTKLAPNLALIAAWSSQIAGRAVGAPGPLDLDNFERHRARLKMVVDF